MVCCDCSIFLFVIFIVVIDPAPPMRPTRIAFGTKVKSPAMMMCTSQMDTTGLVTDADYRANGWDVYRIINKDDVQRVHDAIKASNPERAAWRERNFDGAEPNFGPMFSVDQMFDVHEDEAFASDEEGHTGVQEGDPGIKKEVVEKKEVVAEENEATATEVERTSSALPHNDLSRSDERCDGESAERRWSQVSWTGIPRDVKDPKAPNSFMTRRGVERLRAQFQSSN